MTPHIDLTIADHSHLQEARRSAVRLATDAGFDAGAARRVDAVVTELAGNLIKHATGGRLLIGCRITTEDRALEVLSLDSGPGMADIARTLDAGESPEDGSAIGGLSAVKRLSSEFSAFSAPSLGTVVLSRTRTGSADGSPPPERPIAFAGICLAAPGETVSGDHWDIRFDESEATAMVADGLGHGPGAAQASAEAIRIFGGSRTSPSVALERAHAGMRATRGAAVAIARLDAQSGAVTFAGAGNIAGRLISGVEDRSLMSQHGTVGVQIRSLRDVAYPWGDHAIVVLHSDRIVTRWKLDGLGGLLQCDPAVIAGWILRDHTRGNDDVAIVVMKRSASS